MSNIWVSYEVAAGLKEISFAEECIYHYKHSLKNNSHSSVPTFDIKTHFGANHNQVGTRVSAPLYDQAIDWFIENHKMIIYSISFANGWFWKIDNPLGTIEYQRGISEYKTRREALEAGLIKAIELVKHEKIHS